MTTHEGRDAPTFVFLHCFGGSARSWDPVIAGLGDARDTLALDLPGFGDAAGDPGPYTVAGYADFVETVIGALGSARYLLIGHSMGGKVALALAARQPRGLAGLVLLAPSPPTPEPIYEAMRAELIAGWGQRTAAEGILARIAMLPISVAQRAQALGDLMRSGEAAWRAWLEEGSREDISQAMLRIGVPVTIVSGTADTVLPTALLDREVAARLEDARTVTVQGAGHLLPLEATDAVVAAILRKSRQLDATEPRLLVNYA